MKPWTIRTKAIGVAFSLPIGPGIIVLGQFPFSQVDAVRAHEEAHLRLGHAWTILIARLRSRLDVDEMRRQFELDADADAVRRGHGEGLLAFLWTHGWHPEAPSHPSRMERIAHVIEVAGESRTVHPR